ncbi:amidohydrolase [Dehalobacter sp. DCM]|uniref:amidohydrolase n=1 Tax=Dehalobacter sp. DCM TaxID=2907827 RepID=UPI0030817AA4|nr:amidohydrolase [Dehalobacter sp. DCM]
MEHVKNNIIKAAADRHQDIWDLAYRIGIHPEQGYLEYQASHLLSSYLETRGFVIEHSLNGMATAFFARHKGKQPGPTIAFLAEYDALPDLGHACGHNLIGAASTGAAAVLSMIPEMPGEVCVIGTPAEETSGAKVTMIENGTFQGLDAALMFHPGNANVPEIGSLALDAIEVTYYGKSSHAALVNHNGINALEAVLNLFKKVKRLKYWLAKDERIDGIIIEGGKSPNIIPDKAVARFYLRSGRREDLEILRQRFINAAQKAADEEGARLDVCFYEHSYHEMVTNKPLAHTFANNLRTLGVTDIESPQSILGSIDMGNVSHVVPALHAYLKMGEGKDIQHTSEFAKAAVSEPGEKVLLLAVQALALTGWDVLTDRRLLEQIKKDFF